jgi:hypothetical protein
VTKARYLPLAVAGVITACAVYDQTLLGNGLGAGEIESGGSPSADGGVRTTGGHESAVGGLAAGTGTSGGTLADGGAYDEPEAGGTMGVGPGDVPQTRRQFDGHVAASRGELPGYRQLRTGAQRRRTHRYFEQRCCRRSLDVYRRFVLHQSRCQHRRDLARGVQRLRQELRLDVHASNALSVKEIYSIRFRIDRNITGGSVNKIDFELDELYVYK